MTLKEVLNHVFSDKEMTEEVTDYKVTHTTNDNYTVETYGKITLQVTKAK